MFVAPGFEPVRDAFDDVLSGGAAFAVWRRGEPVVDLYGGQATPGVPWRRDTLAVLFSGTKGIVATVAGILAARGALDPMAPVRTYWPEFAADDVLVHHVLDHTAGFPYVDPEIADPFDTAAATAALARQRPLWTPGSKVAYHALTYGYLLAEILFRITGSTPGALVRDLLATPEDLDLHLGAPPTLDRRTATVGHAPGYRISTFLHDPRRRAIVNRMYGDILSPAVINSAAYRRSGFAAGGAVGTATAMARLYDLLLCGNLVSNDYLATATRTWSAGADVINDRPVRFGLGYELADPIGTYGPVTVAFGHSGAGGGRHGAWPEHGIGFSFLTNELRSEDVDQRAATLLSALHAVVDPG